MKTIPLNNKKELLLPTSWGDLTAKQKQYALGLMIRLFQKEISPFDFQLKMLFFLCGYKPSRKTIFTSARKWWYQLFCSQERCERFTIRQELHAENIQLNLIQLAETLDFAFTVQDETIHPKYDFPDNPFPALAKNAARFLRNYTIDTNITARQFVDACDLLNGIQQAKGDEGVTLHLSCKLIHTLYGMSMEDAGRLAAEIHFGVAFWFTGIVRFFRTHPTYCILFPENKRETGIDKITLGMSETLLYLEKQGYQLPDEMNVVKFFDAQVKSLKDSISKAVTDKVKMEDIIRLTGLSHATIERLI